MATNNMFLSQLGGVGSSDVADARFAFQFVVFFFIILRYVFFSLSFLNVPMDVSCEHTMLVGQQFIASILKYNIDFIAL